MSARGSLLGRLVLASRPLSWVNTAYPFAVAYLLAGGTVDAAFIIGLAIALFFAFANPLLSALQAA